jgi:hypothetical protein
MINPTELPQPMIILTHDECTSNAGEQQSSKWSFDFNDPFYDKSRGRLFYKIVLLVDNARTYTAKKYEKNLLFKKSGTNCPYETLEWEENGEMVKFLIFSMMKM